jgi:hypothetical protein
VQGLIGARWNRSQGLLELRLGTGSNQGNALVTVRRADGVLLHRVQVAGRAATLDLKPLAGAGTLLVQVEGAGLSRSFPISVE